MTVDLRQPYRKVVPAARKILGRRDGFGKIFRLANERATHDADGIRIEG